MLSSNTTHMYPSVRVPVLIYSNTEEYSVEDPVREEIHDLPYIVSQVIHGEVPEPRLARIFLLWTLQPLGGAMKDKCNT